MNIRFGCTTKDMLLRQAQDRRNAEEKALPADVLAAVLRGEKVDYKAPPLTEAEKNAVDTLTASWNRNPDQPDTVFLSTGKRHR